MGGFGSGARRTTNVGNVEDALALDIRALRRLGALRYGECVVTPVRWAQHALSAPRGRLRIDLSEPDHGGNLLVTVIMPGGQLDQAIAIEFVRAQFGGHRCYFICPDTGDRCEVLYYHSGRFASRKAQSLSYAVTSMDELSRVRRRVAKLQCRQNGTGGFVRVRGANRIAVSEKLRRTKIRSQTLYREKLSGLRNKKGC